jgi:cell wall assembly regulator SMI1
MWPDILKQIASSPDVATSVNPPAGSDAIDALERRVGAALPSSFKEYLATMDGQNDRGNLSWIAEFNRLLPVAEIMQLMMVMEELFGDEGPIEHIKENKIQPVLWDRQWVPFSEFEGTPRLILDLHPGRRGLPGQIVLSFPGVDLEDDATVIAPSFAAFSADLLQTLKSRS